MFVVRSAYNINGLSLRSCAEVTPVPAHLLHEGHAKPAKNKNQLALQLTSYYRKPRKTSATIVILQ